ncbi:hypothetical protein B7494_g1749 [Chlorociboria aeruginascens]|nr:hypothetical protein B7494_g1749 [Chlorociboria aeruginascens]
MSIQEVAKAATRQINAVVVSSGLMAKTVKVRVGSTKWNSRVSKEFSRTKFLKVHDPNSSLRTGDVISISPGWRVSKTVHHVVSEILAPFGDPIDARPPVPTEEERIAEKEERMKDKLRRRDLRDALARVDGAILKLERNISKAKKAHSGVVEELETERMLLTRKSSLLEQRVSDGKRS